jgi:hypothetical protein
MTLSVYFPRNCIRNLARLPDHLVRLEEEQRGNGQAQFLRGRDQQLGIAASVENVA